MCHGCAMLPMTDSTGEMNLSMNPADATKAREMRLCGVCGDVTERRHLNYGGEACFSCRAFFRRIHQKLAPPAFECKQGGGCSVNPSTRRRCQKCRYDRCIMAGMRPECVMDEHQRRNRSTKVTGPTRSRKSTSQQNRRGRPSSDGDSASSTPSPPTQIHVRPPSYLLQTPDSDHSGTSTPVNQTSTSPSPPTTPPRGISFMNPRPAAGQIFHLQQRMDLQHEYRMRLQEQMEQKERVLRHMQNQQQQQQEYRRQLHQSALYRSHPYFLPYRRPSPHPPTPSPPPAPVTVVEEGRFGAQPEQYMSQHPLSPTPSPQPEVPFSLTYQQQQLLQQQQQQQMRRPSIPPSDCVMLKSLLNLDDAVEPIPAGLLFTPVSASKSPTPDGIDEPEIKKEEINDHKPFSKKRMILEKLEKEAQQKSSVVATHLKTRHPSEDQISGMSEAQRKLDYLRDSWAMAVNQMGITPELKAKLISAHGGDGGEAEAKSAMRATIFTITRVFRKFALQQEDFCTLSDADQNAIIMRNAAIFVQYTFARYATARKECDKADWMLLEENCVGAAAEELAVEAKSFTEFSDRTGIFPRANRDDMFRYEALLRSLDEPRLNQTHNYLVARACLYHLGSGEEDNFQDMAKIRQFHEDSFAYFETAGMGMPRREEMRHMLLRLDEAVDFFRRHADFFGGPGQDVAEVLQFTHALAMPPSQSEKEWLDKQLDAIKSIGTSVPYSSDQVAEIIRFCYLGQDISVRNTVDILAVNLERSGHLLRSHPEFQALSDEDKQILERTNGLKAVALGHARLEVCSAKADMTSEKALEWLLGESSRKVLDQIKQTFGACGAPFEPRRNLSMREMAAGKFLSAEEITRFESLCARLAPALRDERVFNVALLLVLFSGSHRLSSPDSRRAVAELQRRYIVILKRVLCSSGGDDSDFATVLDSLLLDVNMCLNELSDVAFKYYQRIHDSLCSKC